MGNLKGLWGWSGLTSSHIDPLHAKCKDWETMRASELFGQGGNKLIPFANLCKLARKRLEEIELDDLDGLWELRLSGKRRVWGTRLEHIFYLIWWDPDHTVCPALKK
jgi:hypothetical protein